MMDAEKWKDTILAKSREYVEIGVSVASDLTEKGKTQAKILSNQAKISKAQRQLGALVYSLAKGREENQPLVDKYIDMIDSIEQENRQLKAKLTPAEATEVEHAAAETGRCAGRRRTGQKVLPAVRRGGCARRAVLHQVRGTAVTWHLGAPPLRGRLLRLPHRSFFEKNRHKHLQNGGV